MFCGRSSIRRSFCTTIRVDALGDWSAMLIRRAFLKVGSLQVFGLLGFGDVLRLRAQAPAPVQARHLGHPSLAHRRDEPARYLRSQAGCRFPLPQPVQTDRNERAGYPHLGASSADRAACGQIRHHPLDDPPASGPRSGLQPDSERARTRWPRFSFRRCSASWRKELGRRNELPAAVSIPGATGSWEKAGFLGPRYNPFAAGNPNQDNYKVQDMDLPMGVDWSRMDHRRSLLNVVDEQFRQLDTTGILESMDSYYQTAFQLMHSERAKKAFRIEDRAGGAPRKVRPHAVRARRTAGPAAGRGRGPVCYGLPRV